MPTTFLLRQSRLLRSDASVQDLLGIEEDAIQPGLRVCFFEVDAWREGLVLSAAEREGGKEALWEVACCGYKKVRARMQQSYTTVGAREGSSQARWGPCFKLHTLHTICVEYPSRRVVGSETTR